MSEPRTSAVGGRNTCIDRGIGPAIHCRATHRMASQEDCGLRLARPRGFFSIVRCTADVRERPRAAAPITSGARPKHPTQVADSSCATLKSAEVGDYRTIVETLRASDAVVFPPRAIRRHATNADFKKVLESMQSFSQRCIFLVGGRRVQVRYFHD
jgi:hypothetical protein